jgi:hypothetical protein
MDVAHDAADAPGQVRGDIRAGDSLRGSGSASGGGNPSTTDEVTGAHVLGRVEHGWFHSFRFARIPTKGRNLIKHLPWPTQFTDTLLTGATKVVANAHVVQSNPTRESALMNSFIAA